MHSKYTLGFHEIYNPKIHGKSPSLCYHFIYSLNITPQELFSKEYTQFEIWIQAMRLKDILLEFNISHPKISNYNNIIKNKGFVSIDIVEPILLDTKEYICIIKTFWLKILQRKWKKKYFKRMEFFKNPKSLLNREIHGKWINSPYL